MDSFCFAEEDLSYNDPSTLRGGKNKNNNNKEKEKTKGPADIQMFLLLNSA